MSTEIGSGRSTAGWFKSTFSNPSQDCVEVNFAVDVVHIRDSKDHGTGPVITIGGEHWGELLAEATGRAEAGSNQAVCIEVGDNGGVEVHAPDRGVTLTYTRSEWAAFVAGAVAGEFDLRHCYEGDDDRLQEATLPGVHNPRKTLSQ